MVRFRRREIRKSWLGLRGGKSAKNFRLKIGQQD